MPNTIYTLLKQDHAQLKQMLSQAQQQNSDTAVRSELLETLKEMLTLHTRFEEEVFYPEVRSATGMEEQIDDGLQEHRKADSLLQRLEVQDPISEAWLSTIRELEEAIQHHAGDEEDEIFPRAQQKLDRGRAEAMAAEYSRRKGEA